MTRDRLQGVSCTGIFLDTPGYCGRHVAGCGRALKAPPPNEPKAQLTTGLARWRQGRNMTMG